MSIKNVPIWYEFFVQRIRKYFTENYFWKYAKEFFWVSKSISWSTKVPFASLKIFMIFYFFCVLVPPTTPENSCISYLLELIRSAHHIWFMQKVSTLKGITCWSGCKWTWLFSFIDQRTKRALLYAERKMGKSTSCTLSKTEVRCKLMGTLFYWVSRYGFLISAHA